MTHPVPLLSSAQPVTDEETEMAEALVSAAIRVVAHGTSGGTPSNKTPATEVPSTDDPETLTSLRLDTPERQLFLRQLFLALAVNKDLFLPEEGRLYAVAEGVTILKGMGVIYVGSNIVGIGRIEAAKSDLRIFAIASSNSTDGFVRAVAGGIVRGVLPLSDLWVAGEPVYIDSEGLPIHDFQVPTGETAFRIGFAANPTDLEVCIRDEGAAGF